ncbi:MAG: mannose-1-phosphate guanylyltransferase/mannose-6-phosphate isomerase [Pseudomonadota bacterium]
MAIIPIILAGGSGTRLWPLSRRDFPKQFMEFDESGSLYQLTLKRCAEAGIYTKPVVIANERHRFLAAQQAAETGLPIAAILLEPEARNTAPALAAAASFCTELGGSDAVLHIMPCDHLIETGPEFEKSTLAAANAANDGYLVTFSIKATRPETGYGYIEAGEAIVGCDGIFRVHRFVEKPDPETANAFLETGRYSWNSGMFVFAAGSFLEELASLEPDMCQLARQSVEEATRDLDFTRLAHEPFLEMRSVSIDYALFERTAKSAVCPVDLEWSDLGTFAALHEAYPRDGANNAVRGDTLLIDAHDNLIVSEGPTVAAVGINDLAIIVTDDAVLISPLDRSQAVKSVVDSLKTDPSLSHLADEHKLTLRPWGGYTSMLKRDRFQIKRLFVEPGARLSLQKHHHRSEHWVVVTGTAEVTIDGRVEILSENQSTYIPLGAVHRLGNPGKIRLEVIEVQIGSYLGEDDIIRIDDEFGRA